MKPGWLEDLLRSGKLAELAKKYETQAKLCAALGVTSDAYTGARIRLIGRGVPVPSYAELRAAAVAVDVDVSDFAGEEPTLPNVSVFADTDNEATLDNADEIHHVSSVAAGGDSFTVDDLLTDRRERAEIASLKARLRGALDALEQCRLELATSNAVHLHVDGIEPIRPRETTSGLREATAVALASDWHIEERIDPASVNDVNEYNLDIARRRCERYFEGLAYLINYHADHFAIRDLVLWLGGDLITGYLREENLEHNELSPVQAIATLHVWLVDGIRHVLASTGIESLRIVCNSGNHGRLTEKVRPSTREANSIEWLLYVNLARELSADPRVTMSLPHGSQTYLDVYDWTIRFTHGDETKFGGGVGGIMIPIRKAIAKWQTVRPAHLTVMGHYHSEHFLRDLVVNGSLIGYSPYSLSIAAPYEDPRQAFFLMDRHRGLTFPSTIWVADREAA